MDEGFENEKLAPGLSVALEINKRFGELYPFDGEENGRWELLVKYNGDLKSLEKLYDFQAEELLFGYAIVFISPENIPMFANLKNVEYIELPRRLWPGVVEGKRDSCLSISNEIMGNNTKLSGEGVIVAIIDTGVDYTHPDFRNEDGSTRILAYWDQTLQGKMENDITDATIGNSTSSNLIIGKVPREAPPIGYYLGVLFTKEELDEILQQGNGYIGIKPSRDFSGHGTHVAGIACGNGRYSNGVNSGVAGKADMLVVKIGDIGGVSFPRTTRVLEAVTWCVLYAEQVGKPIAINISFGNNSGSHTGQDLISLYLNQISMRWKNSICVGSGNEATNGLHKKIYLEKNSEEQIEFSIGEETGSVSMKIWLNFQNEWELYLENYNGNRFFIDGKRTDIMLWELEDVIVFINNNIPTPFQKLQEIYIQWIGKESRLRESIWKLIFREIRITDGRVDAWFAEGEKLQGQTRFLNPSVDTTLTTPSSADRVITVGAYDDSTQQMAPFSGRGYTRNDMQKPDIVAPGVNILSVAANGGYTTKSGTSMATPFVTGAAALLMEWGIVQKNDVYLYGEKIKVFLSKGAVPIQNTVPNNQQGYGKLCLKNTFRFIL